MLLSTVLCLCFSIANQFEYGPIYSNNQIGATSEQLHSQTRESGANDNPFSGPKKNDFFFPSDFFAPNQIPLELPYFAQNYQPANAFLNFLLNNRLPKISPSLSTNTNHFSSLLLNNQYRPLSEYSTVSKTNWSALKHFLTLLLSNKPSSFSQQYSVVEKNVFPSKFDTISFKENQSGDTSMPADDDDDEKGAESFLALSNNSSGLENKFPSIPPMPTLLSDTVSSHTNAFRPIHDPLLAWLSTVFSLLPKNNLCPKSAFSDTKLQSFLLNTLVSKNLFHLPPLQLNTLRLWLNNFNPSSNFRPNLENDYQASPKLNNLNFRENTDQQLIDFPFPPKNHGWQNNFHTFSENYQQRPTSDAFRMWLAKFVSNPLGKSYRVPENNLHLSLNQNQVGKEFDLSKNRPVCAWFWKCIDPQLNAVQSSKLSDNYMANIFQKPCEYPNRRYNGARSSPPLTSDFKGFKIKNVKVPFGYNANNRNNDEYQSGDLDDYDTEENYATINEGGRSLYLYGSERGDLGKDEIVEHRIIGGQAVGPGEIPYQVALYRLDIFECGSSLISQYHVLTAGHCLEGRRPEDMWFRVGSDSLIKGGKIYKVANFVIHEEYTNADNDIGLIKSAKAIMLSPMVTPIRLPSLNDPDPLPGAKVSTSGWGATILDGENLPVYQLHKLQLKLTSRKRCSNRIMADVRMITKRQICTTAPKNAGTCFGDSGGPLVSNGRLIGIVSWGSPCAIGDPDVYTNVRAFLPWIYKQMGRSESDRYAASLPNLLLDSYKTSDFDN